MRWRVGQGSRHLHQAAFLLLATHITPTPSLIIQHFHRAAVLPWPLAVTVQTRRLQDSRRVWSMESKNPSPRPSAEEPNGGENPANPFVRDVQRPKVVGPTDASKALPHGDYISLLDVLFSHHGRLNKDMLNKMRRAGGKVKLLEHLSDCGRARRFALSMAMSNRPLRALHALTLSHALGCGLEQNAYEDVAHKLAEINQWHLVRSTVNLCTSQTGGSTVRLLNWRTRALIELQHFVSLEGVLGRFKQERLQPDRRAYHLLVSGHLRNRNLFKARKCLTEMEESGIPIDASTHALIASVYRSLGPDPAVKARALEALRGVDGRLGTIIINSLIQVSLDAGDMPGAFELLNLFNGRESDHGHPPGHGERITQEDGDVTSARVTEVGPVKRSVAVEDASTFTILLNYLATKGDLSRATQLLQQVKAMGVAPDASFAAALVRVLFAAGQGGTAVRIVADMCVGYSVPRTRFEKIGLEHPDRIELPFDFSSISPTTEVFNALLKGVLKTHGLNGMHTIQHIMHSCGIRVDEHTLEIYLSYLDKGDRARPREIIRSFRNLLFHGISPNLRHLHVILRSVLRRERYRLRRRSWDKSDTSSSVETLAASGRISGVTESLDPSAGIKLPRKYSYRALASRLMRSLQVRGVKSDRATFALRIQHDAVVRGDLAMAERSFQQMVHRGMHPNEYHFAALMEGHAQAGDLQSAAEVMKTAAASGVRPNAVMYTILIVGHARRRNPTQAVRAFHDMIAAGIKPDKVAIAALIRAFIIVRAFRDARRALLQLWPTVAPFPEELHDEPLKQLMKVFSSLNPSNGNVPERLSSQKQRMLRWKMQRLAATWQYSAGRRGRERSLSYPRHVSGGATDEVT